MVPLHIRWSLLSLPVKINFTQQDLDLQTCLDIEPARCLLGLCSTLTHWCISAIFKYSHIAIVAYKSNHQFASRAFLCDLQKLSVREKSRLQTCGVNLALVMLTGIKDEGITRHFVKYTYLLYC